MKNSMFQRYAESLSKGTGTKITAISKAALVVHILTYNYAFKVHHSSACVLKPHIVSNDSQAWGQIQKYLYLKV